MLAIDTNVIVRYLTGDHPAQAARAKALIDGEDIFAPTTAILETEWVLRAVYSFAPGPLANALAAFAGLPTVTLENERRVAKALGWMRAGMDFADALHIASVDGCDAFVSFDAGLAKKANTIADVKVRAP